MAGRQATSSTRRLRGEITPYNRNNGQLTGAAQPGAVRRNLQGALSQVSEDGGGLLGAFGRELTRFQRNGNELQERYRDDPRFADSEGADEDNANGDTTIEELATDGGGGGGGGGSTKSSGMQRAPFYPPLFQKNVQLSFSHQMRWIIVSNGTTEQVKGRVGAADPLLWATDVYTETSKWRVLPDTKMLFYLRDGEIREIAAYDAYKVLECGWQVDQVDIRSINQTDNAATGAQYTSPSVADPWLYWQTNGAMRWPLWQAHKMADVDQYITNKAQTGLYPVNPDDWDVLITNSRNGNFSYMQPIRQQLDCKGYGHKISDAQGVLHPAAGDATEDITFPIGDNLLESCTKFTMQAPPPSRSIKPMPAWRSNFHNQADRGGPYQALPGANQMTQDFFPVNVSSSMVREGDNPSGIRQDLVCAADMHLHNNWRNLIDRKWPNVKAANRQCTSLFALSNAPLNPDGKPAIIQAAITFTTHMSVECSRQNFMLDNSNFKTYNGEIGGALIDYHEPMGPMSIGNGDDGSLGLKPSRVDLSKPECIAQPRRSERLKRK